MEFALHLYSLEELIWHTGSTVNCKNDSWNITLVMDKAIVNLSWARMIDIMTYFILSYNLTTTSSPRKACIRFVRRRDGTNRRNRSTISANQMLQGLLLQKTALFEDSELLFHNCNFEGLLLHQKIFVFRQLLSNCRPLSK